jgi:hypothetical protein
MDVLFGKLLNELKLIKIVDKLNIIVVSDHGMQQLKSDSNIALSDYVNLALIDKQRSVYGVVSNIYPASKNDVVFILNNLNK